MVLELRTLDDRTSSFSEPNAHANPPAPRTRGADQQALACWRSVLSDGMDSSRSFGIIVPAGVMWCECQRNQEESRDECYNRGRRSGKERLPTGLCRFQLEDCFHRAPHSIPVPALLPEQQHLTGHHGSLWLRPLLGSADTALGIEVRLLPARYIRAYVKRNKTDAADAAALLEAARCGDILPVRIKSVEQQALQSLHRTRTLWMSTRTARINALRGFCREFGIDIAQGARLGLEQIARA